MIFYQRLLLHVVSALVPMILEVGKLFFFPLCLCQVVLLYSFVARLGAKFIPKAKSKQFPRKGIPASEHSTSSKDGILGNECQNAVASALSMPAEEPKGSVHHTQVEIPNSEDSTNRKQVSVKGDSAALVDDSTITATEVDADQKSMNFLKPICEVTEGDPVYFEGASVTSFVPETNLNNGTTQPVHPANAVENEFNVAAPSATCSAIDRMKEQPKIGEGSFLDSNKLIDNSIQVGTDLGFQGSSDDKIAIIQSNFDSKSNFGKKQEGVSAEFELDPFSNILPYPGAGNVHKFKPKIKPRPRVSNVPAIASDSSNVMMEKSVELPTSCTNDFQFFQSCGDGSGGLNQSASLPLPTSEILRTTELPDKFDDTSSSILSEDNKSLAAAIPSQLDSLNAMLSEDAVHNGTTDWPSSFGKSSREAADIFSGLESLDDFLTQAATGTGKPALHSFNGKGGEENFVTPASSSINSFGECDTTQVQRCPEYHTPQDSLTFNEAAVFNEDDIHTSNRRLETEEIVDLNPACPGDDVIDYQSMKSGEDPTLGIPVHEELTNAADSPTLVDFLHADVTREKEDSNKRKKDGSTSCSLRKNRRCIAGEEDKGAKTSRQLRKQAARKPVNSSLNEDVEDNNDLDPSYNSNGDELQENDDEYEVDYPSRKRRVSNSSQKKPVAKSGKTSQKPKKANDDLEKTEEPPKKFSHSTRRRKRCVDKALLEIPEDELDRLNIPIKDIILLEEHRERLAKKEAMTSNTSSTNQSGGDSLHEAGSYNEGAYDDGAYDDGAYNDEEFLGSEDGRDPYDNQANEGITSTSVLLNYQSFREKKTPRGKWSKQETELFYEAVREMGTDFSVIQKTFFPDKTRHQIKLKYKKEERQQPLQLTDAVNNSAKDHPHSKLFIELLKLASTKAEEYPGRDASDLVMAEEVVDLTAGTHEEVPKAATKKEDADVKAQEDSVAVPSPEQSDDSDDDFQKWSQYKCGY
ncbi:hypothetical protein AAZX31_11G010700 [Glycine max]|nr:hypothetical protein GLYMA_11G010900v4 [Glycine max]KAG4386246.1 hypothetical protein GLYMA_11G010900v4 [Glycine max]KAH1156998.1 hypothetical protein GYH30_029678 [Glycine max]KAH1157000.1 hypothetical protein GYH30_029678 [Glycine max]